ncbi:metalloprotease TldD [Buchnera aphidicola]|uniref:Metalloprotease TldD n=1 Tax=Buchnera aphidicola (Anoecia oenotherae) TaxID=1241833 RepID=A0A4D6Y4T6_9GAMM|nr:metalloprotease TldD [Buchnera aphidicola]QCI19435.1 metalloprotease TldD [Buchnera aphidicola (Anoecia oenotherae)]
MHSSVINNLLISNKITQEDIFNILSDLLKKNIDYADIYIQSIFNESWILENNIVKEGYNDIDQGLGVRTIFGESTGFAYSNSISLKSLLQSSKLSSKIATNFKKSVLHPFCSVKKKQIFSTINPLNSLTTKDKLDILLRVNSTARGYNSKVIEVNACLSSTYEEILIASTDGNLATDIRPLVHLSIVVLVENNGKIESGSSGGGRRTGYQFFLSSKIGENYIDYLSKEAVRIALINLFAKETPSGSFPVVLGSGWPGILLHEAIGHGLESDFNRKKTSIFSNKIGSQVTSKLCTIIDDGTLLNKRGSLNIDDEGVLSQKTILIKEGILINYMYDKFNARLMNTKSTGNGRRQSYKNLPMPRMTNTYMLSGFSSRKNIIESVDNGLYAVNFSDGQVDITSGNFVFSTSEAYVIKKGKISYPVKKAMLIGSGIDVMNNISMIGNDFNMDEGIGTCMKEGQSLPVGVGQPTLKIDQITVGGTVK